MVTINYDLHSTWTTNAKIMKLTPAKYLIHSPALQVLTWREIKSDAEKMLDLVSKKFIGLHELAYALSHCQVVESGERAQPIVYAFFVVHPDLVKQRLFRHGAVVINPRIVSAPEKVKIPRQIAGKLQPEVRNGHNVSESCMSFPFRHAKTMYRYHEVRVEYQVPGWFGLRTVRETLTGLAAHVFQHETDHANGKNIYHA